MTNPSPKTNRVYEANWDALCRAEKFARIAARDSGASPWISINFTNYRGVSEQVPATGRVVALNVAVRCSHVVSEKRAGYFRWNYRVGGRRATLDEVLHQARYVADCAN